ncbi:MAG: Rieske (2Fe-2S) protein [Dehalococcoidia bacterium]
MRRRNNGRWLLLFTTGTALALAVVAVAMFSWPAGGDSGLVKVPLADITGGSAYCDREHGFCITSESLGAGFALDSLDPHPVFSRKGCRVDGDVVPGVADRIPLEVLRSPCSGATFDVLGVRLFGPAPSDLRRLAVELEGDYVLVRP